MNIQDISVIPQLFGIEPTKILSHDAREIHPDPSIVWKQ